MSDNEKIGALWVKQSAKGDFFTGKIKSENGEEFKIVVFKNGYKEKETQPDYLILKSKEMKKDFSMDDVDIVENDDDLPF